MLSMLLASTLFGEAVRPKPTRPVSCTIRKARAENRREGLLPAEAEDDQPGADHPGGVFFMTLQCGSRAYLVRLVKSGATPSEPETEAGPITVRFEGKKAFLRADQGLEKEGTYVEIPWDASKPGDAKPARGGHPPR